MDRPSRTQTLEKRIKQMQKNEEDEEKNANEMKKKYFIVCGCVFFYFDF